MNFYPWDIDRFRKAIESGVRERFEHVPFRAMRVSVAPRGPAAPSERRVFPAPARIFGTPEDPACLQDVATFDLDCPAPVPYRVANGIVVDSGTLCTEDGRIYAPGLVDSPAALDGLEATNASNIQQFVLHRDSDTAATVYHFWNGSERRIGGTFLFLPDREAGNYGSFLFRVMPHLLAAAQRGLRYDFIVASDRSHWLLDALRLLDLPVRPILLPREIFGCVLSDVVFFNDFSVEGFFAGETVAAFRALADRVGGGRMPDGQGAKLYVSRTLSQLRTPNYRILVNEIGLESRARERGFTVVYPETMTFADQIVTFARSRRIAGPSGSGMLNAVFAPQGARVLDLECFHVTVRQHAKVYASTGKAYAFAFGRFDARDERPDRTVRNWVLPPDLFDTALDWLLDD